MTETFQLHAGVATRPKVNKRLEKAIAEYAQHGMKIIPVGHLRRPATLLSNLELAPDDFVVGGYMAASPLKYEHVRMTTQLIPQLIGDLSDKYNLKMPIVSGGGNYKGDKPDDESSNMGHWTYGATRNGRIGRFVIMEGLLILEGLPRLPGIAVCIKQDMNDPNDARIGHRTDGLETAILGLRFANPGGFGTIIELFAHFTNHSIDAGYAPKKSIIVDHVVTNPETGLTSNYFTRQFEACVEYNQGGAVSDRTAKKVNDHCLVYRPAPHLTSEQIAREAMMLGLAVRAAAPTFNPAAGYAPVPQQVLIDNLQPLDPQSTIGHIFDNHPMMDRSWGDEMQYLSSAHRSSGPRIAGKKLAIA